MPILRALAQTQRVDQVDRALLKHTSTHALLDVNAVAMSGIDQVFGFPSAWGLGYGIGQFLSNAHETQHIFGVGGVGGSHADADRASGIAFALTKNRLAPSFETAERIAAIVTQALAER